MGKPREPEEPGYYWAKLFSHQGDPCIVYVNSRFVVSACGDRNRYSFHYDVVEWCSGKIEFKENEE